MMLIESEDEPKKQQLRKPLPTALPSPLFSGSLGFLNKAPPPLFSGSLGFLNKAFNLNRQGLSSPATWEFPKIRGGGVP